MDKALHVLCFTLKYGKLQCCRHDKASTLAATGRQMCDDVYWYYSAHYIIASSPTLAWAGLCKNFPDFNAEDCR